MHWEIAFEGVEIGNGDWKVERETWAGDLLDVILW
jgi:hypothetical protein